MLIGGNESNRPRPTDLTVLGLPLPLETRGNGRALLGSDLLSGYLSYLKNQLSRASSQVLSSSS